MSQSVALNKKGSNPNKAQSPLKNMNFDMQYRSSTELANHFKIKREQLANERNDKAKKEHAPIAHKRKNSKDFIPQQGKSKLVEYKSVIQLSSREELGTSHMVVGKGQTKKSIFQSGESIQEKGVTASVHVIAETLGNTEEQHDIQDLLNFKQVKRKSVLPATSLDQFQEEQQLQKEHDINDLPNCNTKGTISRNPRFINLMYTSWHAVPKDTKKRMWEYINSKFLIPVEGKKWVITGLHDAWRRHKQKIKERSFDKNSTVEDMLAKRPNDMPEGQSPQLIKYWKHPTVQAMCEMNSQNRKKQKWRHRMGPINFARVRVALRATKENNEEPSKCEMFIATRTKTGKEIQADTQVAIAELQNHQNSGETADDAFTAVFENEQPGRLSQLLENNPGLNVRDMPGCVGFNIASPIDASSAQAVKGQNLPHFSGSTHDSILQKLAN
ncbi:hypothetical protein KY285_022197 [Solanum tuberosum]|nr:hypothetical protein KY289_020467 [Solanum tuberosum]KAH0695100.1 hypothetical protein KY285_022197 [Solanum tuberosum]